MESCLQTVSFVVRQKRLSTHVPVFQVFEAAIPPGWPRFKGRGIPIAIATGDWRETISFKLRAAVISFDDIPMVTSSEFYSRADIIAAAVAKTGRSLEEAVCV